MKDKGYSGPKSFNAIVCQIHEDINHKLNKEEIKQIISLYFGRQINKRYRHSGDAIRVPGLGTFFLTRQRIHQIEKEKKIETERRERQKQLNQAIRNYEKVQQWKKLRSLRMLNYLNLKLAEQHNAKYLTLEDLKSKRVLRKIPFLYFVRLNRLKLC
jgi:uncharacterized FlaG/YvyC family protein